MSLNLKKIIVYHWLSILFIVFLISVVIFYFAMPFLKDFFNYMTGLATILLALLTGIYVYTTNRQLEVMKNKKKTEFR